MNVPAFDSGEFHQELADLCAKHQLVVLAATYVRDKGVSSSLGEIMVDAFDITQEDAETLLLKYRPLFVNFLKKQGIV